MSQRDTAPSLGLGMDLVRSWYCFCLFLRKSRGGIFKDFKELKDLKDLKDKGDLDNKKQKKIPHSLKQRIFFTTLPNHYHTPNRKPKTMFLRCATKIGLYYALLFLLNIIAAIPITTPPVIAEISAIILSPFSCSGKNIIAIDAPNKSTQILLNICAVIFFINRFRF